MNKNDFAAYFVVSTSAFALEYTCRRCNKTFIFNNRLHFHLRSKCFRQSFFINKLVTNNYSSKVLFYFIKVSFTKVFFIDVIKVTNTFVSFKIDKSTVIRFNVDVFKNVDTEYEFRDWNYVKTKIFLIENNVEENDALNIDIDIFFSDYDFIRKQKSNFTIRKMISFIIVRNLNIIQH